MSSRLRAGPSKRGDACAARAPAHGPLRAARFVAALVVTLSASCAPRDPRVEADVSPDARADVSADVSAPAPDADDGPAWPEPPRPATDCPGEVADGVCLPLPPRFLDWDCPAGWETRRDDGGAWCAPAPTDDCPDDAVRTPAGCVQTTPCPEGEWPETEAPPGARTHHVLAGADGDGTRGAPFGDVGAALAEAEAGDMVLVGAGRYAEHLQVDEAIHLIGACPGRVTLAATEDAPLIALTAGGSLRGFTLEGGRTAVRVAGDALVEDVVVRGADAGLRVEGVLELRRARFAELEGAGISVQRGATLRAFDVHVIAREDAPLRAAAAADVEGRGLWLEGAASETFARRFALRASALRAEKKNALHVIEGAAELTDVAVFGPPLDAAVLVDVDGGALSGRRVTLDGRGGILLQVARHGAATLEHFRARGVREATGQLQPAIDVHGRATLSHGVVRWHGDRGAIFASGDLSVADLDLGAAHASDPAHGVNFNGGDGRLARVRVRAFREFAVRCAIDCDLVLTDLRADPPVMSGGTNTDGHALWVGWGARAVAERVLADRPGLFGVHVMHEGTEFTVRDLTIRDPQPGRAGRIYGSGLMVDSMGRLTVERARLEGARVVAAAVFGSGHLTLRDAWLVDTDSGRAPVGVGEVAEDVYGVGVYATERAEIELERVVVDGARGAGVMVRGEADAPTLDARHLAANRVRPMACVDSHCPDFALGAGLWAWWGGEDMRAGVALDRVHLGGAQPCVQTRHLRVEGARVRVTDCGDGLVEAPEGAATDANAWEMRGVLRPHGDRAAVPNPPALLPPPRDEDDE